jgi:thiol-disulfide isomerase/thioredoxin
MFFGLFIQITAAGQDSVFKELRIGDRIPDIELNYFYTNDSAYKQKINSFKSNKYLIINFWATWCSPCIQSMAYLDSLRLQYKNHLEIIAVTTEPKRKVTDFFKRQTHLSGVKLPILSDDKILVNLFRHKIIPHIVWIDKEGFVKFITHKDQINRKNIESFLNNQAGTLVSKPPDDLKFSMFQHLKAGDSGFLYRSVLTKGNMSIPGGVIKQPIASPRANRIFAFNMSIRDLYWIASSHFRVSKFNPYRLILEIRDSSKYVWPESFHGFKEHPVYKTRRDWMKENLYCYELILPEEVDNSDFFDFMLNDLNRFFKSTGSFEKRRVECLILVDSAFNDRLYKSEQKESKTFWTKTGDLRSIQRQPIDTLISYLNMYGVTPLIVNGTNIKSLVTMQLNLKTSTSRVTIQDMQNVLSQYGLSFKREFREADVFILKDRHR